MTPVRNEVRRSVMRRSRARDIWAALDEALAVHSNTRSLGVKYESREDFEGRTIILPEEEEC